MVRPQTCLHSALSFVLLAHSAAAAAASTAPTLDVTNPKQLVGATTQAMNNLLGYFPASNTGTFDQVQVPWATSGMVWMAFMDYLKWTGDGQFSNEVTAALVNMSYGKTQDFLDGAQAALQSSILGKWNDDILWPAQASIAGAEVFGYQSVIPASGGQWIVVPQKTLDQAWTNWNVVCGGGILWSRDRYSPSANYVSVITNMEFIQTGARIFVQSGNKTALNLAEQTINWLWSSGIANYKTGVIYDGFDDTNCDIFEVSQWSYNYGELLGALAWMHKATGNQTYLDIATPFLNTAIKTFTNTAGALTEKCEAAVTCNRDQMTFKGILARGMSYLYRETSDPTVRTTIMTTLDKTVAAMMANSCDSKFNCNGNFTAGSGVVYYPQSQVVAVSMLISSLGIHTNATGNGLMPVIDVPKLNLTTSGTQNAPAFGTYANGTSAGNPYVVSTPLQYSGAASMERAIGASALGLVAGIIVLL